MACRFSELVVDSRDPGALAAFCHVWTCFGVYSVTSRPGIEPRE
jgi:hypothetical protein